MEREAATGTITVGAALLARLKAVGIDHIFVNSGTDSPMLVEIRIAP